MIWIKIKIKIQEYQNDKLLHLLTPQYWLRYTEVSQKLIMMISESFYGVDRRGQCEGHRDLDSLKET